jgi:ribosomal protein L29
MARKKIKDIRKLNDEDLGSAVRDARRKFFDLRTQAVTEKIEDTSQFRKTRQHVARLLTEQKSRQAPKAGDGNAKPTKKTRTKAGAAA